ncbi:HAMP domain-containing histidine kinase [Simiduia sp. 21SJ11W-1]|uniref:sensor histidine kinase n=1 Tax=Simiduia sp. 21SJ11W-1 TaxID=2909669 RepID=UPI00209EAFD9|nr:HAMP domain-containing sensor histidine kinase [Simiduia sp. 21SJ11W-1]UTA46512.1 HAMP domain-containing histidine kinase [Simiduia sp. 21SJ11W-1]
MNSPKDRQDSVADFSFMLASSVHDMKNSLGMLLNTLDETMREMPPKTPVQQSRYATLQYEASRINGELIQLLSLYRMNLQAMPVHVEENYVRDVLDEQLARNDMLFVSRHLNVELACDENLLWYFDSELVSGVVHNVLVNCARYTRSKLCVKAWVDEGLYIEVADDGQGYPQAMLSQPIDLNAGVSFESGSTNLGLYFAQTVARLHKTKAATGRISLANGGALGGGIFTLFLP